jgi:hypothetical protein
VRHYLGTSLDHTYRGFNLFDDDDQTLFEVLCRGEFGCNTLGMGANRFLERLGELLRVVEHPDAAAVEQRRHRVRMAHTRQRSADHDAVETRKDTHDLVADVRSG